MDQGNWTGKGVVTPLGVFISSPPPSTNFLSNQASLLRNVYDSRVILSIINLLFFKANLGVGNLTTDTIAMRLISVELSKLLLKSPLILLYMINWTTQICVMDQTRWDLPCGKTLRRKCHHDDWSHQRSRCRFDEVRSTPAAHCQDSCWQRRTGLQKNMRNGEKHWKNIESVWVFQNWHVSHWSSADYQCFVREKCIIFGKFHQIFIRTLILFDTSVRFTPIQTQHFLPLCKSVSQLTEH